MQGKPARELAPSRNLEPFSRTHTTTRVSLRLIASAMFVVICERLHPQFFAWLL
jgi:hypothetical protein